MTITETNTTTLVDILLKEQEQEAQSTRKMLERIPDDKYDWKPHEKSMTIRRLATHIADISNWVAMALTTDELDFAKNQYKEELINNTAELLDYFERSYKNGRDHLKKANDQQLTEKWTMRNGNQIYFTATRGEVIRMSYSQIVHHRAQLGVYLRLLNVPIPGPYGPSADEMQG